MRGTPDRKQLIEVRWVFRILKRCGCNMHPVLLALRPDMPGRLQLTGVVERARFDAHELGLPKHFVKQPRTACWTETTGHAPTRRRGTNPLFDLTAQELNIGIAYPERHSECT